MGDEENGDAAVALDTPLAKIPGLAEDGELDEDAVLDFAGRVGQRFALVPNEKKVAGFETLADVVDWVVASKDAPILVVAWSPRCPMCKNVYDERMVEILGDTGARLVVLASNAPDNVQHVNDYLEMNDYHWNVIMDGDQRLTNRLGGLRTPHCFLLDSTRHLRYRGSFDNDPRGSKEGDEHKEYLRSAIEAVSNGGQVAPDMTETEPVG
jgi:hypothetical protein